MRGILDVDLKSIHIHFNPDDLKSEGEVITVGGETDEEFQTRRNTFLRWAFGLPKKRKQPTHSFVAYKRAANMKITVNLSDLQFFKDWMHRDIKDIKCDCDLIVESPIHAQFFLFPHMIKLQGVFPIEWSEDIIHNVILSYDCFTFNKGK